MGKILIIDMDEVLALYTKKVIETLKKESGMTIDLHKVKGKFLSQSLDPQLVEIVSSYPYRKGFFRDLEIIPGSRDVIRQLMKSYEIFIASACLQHPNSVNDKLEWLNDNFPFIPFQKIILCGEKKTICGDYLVDDHPKHLAAFKGKPLLFSAFHNLDENRFERFDNWEMLGEYLLRTV